MSRVSVIIPTYNRADYLAEALRSVLGQTRKPFEVIVVDDGSEDHTTQVVRAFEPDVRFFRQDHAGVSAARNLGLDAARGDVIAWLDADDLWEPDFLETMISRLAEDRKLDGVYSGWAHIDAAGNSLPQSSHRVVPPADLYLALTEGNFLATPAIVVRKRCFEVVGSFDTQLGICEDYDMWLRLAKDFTIAGLPAPLVRIRVHDGNTVQDTAAFSRYRLALVQKHYGSLDGSPSKWTEEKKRAVALAYREAALTYSQDGQLAEKRQYLDKAILVWPELLSRLDTFYELACDEQPRGYRGHATSLDIEGTSTAMLQWLDGLFARAGSTLEPLRRNAYGNAYLALSMLSDQSGRWQEARRHMSQAIKANPRLLGSSSVLRRLVKLYAGQRVIGVAQSLRR